jgi:hypothetical protein
MATIREYFDTDLKHMALHKPWLFGDPTISMQTEVTARISLDFDANTKYWSFYIPDNVDIGSFINTIFNMQETRDCVLEPEGDTVGYWVGFFDYSERMYSETLIFTKRIFLYIDALLNVNDRKAITDLGLSSGFYVVVRDNEYAKLKSDIEKPLAFISHDSRDKDELVRELALELSKLMCPVWYDEYSLKVGGSLRESIEKGIKETKNCIVVLSANFFNNDGWGKTEYDSIFTREIIEKENVMLPIWHNVTAKEVYEYSPKLADKFGLNSSLGAKELARKLCNTIKSSCT